MRARRAPMLNKAGNDTIKANKSFLIPLAALISLNIRPILKTLTTLKRVGETGKSCIMSSMTMPTILAITRTKSNTFHPAVKYWNLKPMIFTTHSAFIGRDLYNQQSFSFENLNTSARKYGDQSSDSDWLKGSVHNTPIAY